MQELQDATSPELLSAQQVQTLLGVDRSTIYRMAEDGRLPALKVGRQWRFPADRVRALLQVTGPGGQAGPVLTAGGRAASGGPVAAAARTASAAGAASAARPVRIVRPASPAGAVGDALTGPEAVQPDVVEPDVAASVAQVAADLLGVMMVVTDMDGHPITGVSNPCRWFADRADDPGLLDACVAEWQQLADDPDFEPRFAVGALGFECARAFVRRGTSLVGMVLVGGVAPAEGGPEGLYELDAAERRRVLAALPRVAAALSRIPPRAPLRPPPR